MSLLYLKLITGEEIVGTVEDQNGKLKVSDPLMFECGVNREDPNRRYVYMARYAPFLDKFCFEIETQQVLFQGQPSDIVARYYPNVSLAYCKNCTDISFNTCVSETTDQIASVLDPKEAAKKTIQETEDLLENLLMVVPGPSKQLH